MSVDRGDADGPGIVRRVGERRQWNFSAPEVVIARPEYVSVLAPFEVRLKGCGGQGWRGQVDFFFRKAACLRESQSLPLSVDWSIVRQHRPLRHPLSG